MLLHGDELGRTQQGNNNAYCQDNEISWIDWSDVDEELLTFTRQLIALRLAHPAFRRRKFFQGTPIRVPGIGPGLADIAWFDTAGEEMTDEQWHEAHARALMAFVNGDDVGTDRRGERVVDNRFLLLFNGHHESLGFTLPPHRWGVGWAVVLDTDTGVVEPADGSTFKAGETVELEGRTVVLLRHEEPGG